MVYRIEVRTDFVGDETEARAEASRLANLVNGEVTAIWDEDWEELD